MGKNHKKLPRRRPQGPAVVAEPVVISSTAFLLRGISSIPGELTLTQAGRLKYVANGGPGSAWGWQLRKIEHQAGRPGLAKRIDAGDDAVVFDVPVASVAVRFPWYYFSGGLVVTLAGVQYKFSLGTPANMQLPTDRGDIDAVAGRVETELGEVATMRRAGKAWQAALSGT
ncbi:MAG: hypothetical protein HY854_21430 [Burkholderiales bacterium]|nr:hypothetical protein [Burkholderiales bacterium]